MLKRRVVAVLVVSNGLTVQSINFSDFFPVGRPEIAANFFNQWGVDEIIYLDISATKLKIGPDISLVKRIANECRSPLTVGGGVRNIDDVHRLMSGGADKIAVNKAFIDRPEFIEEIAKSYGKQAIVGSIDALLVDGSYWVYDYINKKKMTFTPWDYASNLEKAGVGEILINSVNRDGSKLGFDIQLIEKVCDCVRIPVIACGGVGIPEHLLHGLLHTRASAVAAANMFHFYEHSITIAKALISKNLQIRHETHVTYEKHSCDSMGRLLKLQDDYLEEMLYQKIGREVI